MVVQEGNLLGSGKKFAIIGSRFNEFITSKLIGGAEDCLLRHDVKQEDITVIWVPGAYEIPLIAKKAALSGRYDAVICVGAVIRGSTTHYDYVCNEVAKGIAHVSLETGIPVMFGVVTTENIEQACGTEGFGYDPIVFIPEFGKTVAQLSKEQKNAFSHRGKAARKILQLL